MRSAFPIYLTGLASWFVPLGIQTVLFPWLVAVVLRMDAFAVGVAQAAAMLPSLLFLPLGGLVADRGNPRRLLMIYHLLYACPPLFMFAVLWSGELSYPLLIAYGVGAGAIGAFAIPTRDALLPTVAGANLPRAVALVTALQFGGQLIGIAFASTADWTGPLLLLALQSALVALGTLAVWRLPDPPVHAPHAPTSFWRSMAEGVSAAARSDQIWPVLLINVGIGIFYVGPFVAVLPLAIRDRYDGAAAELGYMNLAFWSATILASMAFAGIGRRFTLRGRLIGLAVSMGAGILGALALLPPFPVFVALIFVWGIGAGTTMTQARTVLQIVAPASHRARLMALYQLGFGGGAPIGAFLTGSIAAVWGLQTALVLPAVGMLLLIVVVLARSRLWSMRTVE